MQTTRRDFFKHAGTAVVAGALGFPAVGRAQARPDALSASVTTGLLPTPGQTAAAVASNGYLSSLLPLEDRLALRKINVDLTRLAIEQCAADGVANQIVFGTLICEALVAFAAHDVFPDDLLQLSRDFDVVFLWSLAYGNVRTPFNARFVRFPLAIAFPRTVDEVVFWINFVREHEFSVSIRSGNNSYEGFSTDNEIVLDLTFLTLRSASARKKNEQFRLDLKAGVVHVASGVRLGVLYTELAKSGVTVAGGQCSPVCVGGLVGTGGVGFSTREFGYVCDQLVEVEYVLADGSVVVANAGNEHADLFRATKGAGAAGLGVMTRLSLRVVPAVTVLYYTVTFNLTDAAIVLDKWQNLAAAAPDALSSVANITANAVPSAGPVTFFFDGEFRVEQGTVQAAKQQLESVLRTQWLDLLSPSLKKTPIEIDALTTVEAATVLAVQAPMPTFNQWKLKSNFVFRRLSAETLKPLVDFLLTHAPADDPSKALGALTILLTGGKANRSDPNSAVVPARAGTVTWFHGGAVWNEQELEAQSLAFVEALSAVLKPIVQSQTAQYGAPDRQLGSQLPTPPDFSYLKAYWSSPTLNFVPFLIGVKRRYDPQDLFQFAQSIPVNLPI
jgi:hypothetical protein